MKNLSQAKRILKRKVNVGISVNPQTLQSFDDSIGGRASRSSIINKLMDFWLKSPPVQKEILEMLID